MQRKELCLLMYVGFILLGLMTFSEAARSSVSHRNIVADSTKAPVFATEEIDSLALLDSLLSEADELEESVDEPERLWKTSAKSTYSTQQLSNGADLSESAPTMSLGARISYKSNLYCSISGTQRLGASGFYQQTDIGAGYSYPAADWWDLSADLAYTKYANDSLNPLAGTNLALSIGSDFYTNVVNVGLYFDRYFGSDAASFLSLNVSRDIAFDTNESFVITPSISTSVTKYNITQATRNKKGKTTTTTNTSPWLLSALSFDIFCTYQLSDAISVYFDPMIVIPYEADLQSKKNARGSAQLAATLSVQYALKF